MTPGVSRITTSAATCAVALALTVVLAAGCTVGPDFVRPAAPDVKRYTHKPLPAETTSVDIPNGGGQRFIFGKDLPGQWWTLFRSPLVNQMVGEALRSNPDLLAAQATLREAHENYLASIGALFPAFDSSFGATRQKSPGALFGRPGVAANIYTLYTAQAQVSYTLDVFGGTRRQIEQNRATVNYQRFQLEGAYLTLTSNVVNAVGQIALRHTQIEVNREVTEAQQKIVNVIQNQVRFGGAARSDLELQRAQLAQLQAELPTLQKELAQQEDLLATLTGRFPSQLAPLKIDLMAFELPQDLPVSLPSQLVQQRPDVRAAEAQLHEASAAIGVATAAQLPQFTISGDLGSVAARPGELFSPGGGFWSIGGKLLVPLFDGGQLLHKKRAAVAEYDRAAAQYRSIVLSAFKEVTDALRAMVADSNSLKAQVDAERASENSFHIAQQQLKLGGISYPTLLQSELTYEQTRSNVVTAQVAKLSDIVALFEALGGGWWNRQDVAPANAPNTLPARAASTASPAVAVPADDTQINAQTTESAPQEREKP